MLHYASLRFTTLHRASLRFTTLHYASLRFTTLHYASLRFTTLHYASLRFTTLHYASLRFTAYTTFIATATTITILQSNYIIYTTTLQLQLPLRHITITQNTTPRPAVVGEVTIATIPNSTTPTTFRSISGLALPSMCHNKQPVLLSLKLPPPPGVVLLVP